MRKFWVLSFVIIGVMAWIVWPRQKTTTVSNSLAHIEKPTKPMSSVSVVQPSTTLNAAEAPPLAPQDAESLGHECIGILTEKAQPQLNDFRNRVTSDPTAPVGMWMYDATAKIQPAPKPSAPDYFLRGIAAANLMAGRENKNPDLPSSLNLFIKAGEMDPKNAAAFLFAAYIQKQLGNEIEAQELLEQIQIDDMRFDTYQMEPIHQMYKHVKNTQEALLVFQISSQLPIVNPSEINLFLRTVQRQDIGYLMIENELDPQSKYRSHPDGDIIFYSSGYSHIRSLSSTDAEKYPHPRLLMEKMKDHVQYKLINTSDLGRECDLGKLQPLVDYFQEIAN